MTQACGKLFERAQQVIPGGVNSPVRAFKAVGGSPVFMTRGKGPYLYDSEGKSYIDYVGSWGPMILGHADPDVVLAVQTTAEKGLSFGAPTEAETAMAELICGAIPSIEQVRMVNSGTEAAMSAVRLARGFTGRDKVIKFEGCYHGHADGLLVKAGSGALTLGVPTSPGVPAAMAQHTLTLEFNNAQQIEDIFSRMGPEIAAVIVEPVAGNMNCVPGSAVFHQALRHQCNQYGAVLIFDEVMTGFRVAPGGAQALYGIVPDLTTLGKVIGGGLPVGAFGGRAEIMQHLAPAGSVYQAGTLSGNPLAMAAGLATLHKVLAPTFFQQLEQKTSRLVDGLRRAGEVTGVPMVVNQAGSMFGFFFTASRSVTCFSEVMASDPNRFQAFFHAMLEAGVYLAPSAFETAFMSIAHGDSEIDQTIEKATAALHAIA